MRNLSIVCILIFLLVLSGPAYGQDAGLQDKIHESISKKVGDVNIGVYVKNLTSGKDVVDIHKDRFFVPASTVKILTSYMALKYLGPEFRFETTVYADKKPSSKSLDGDLCIKFVGDPSLKYDDLDAAFDALPINNILGNVSVDNSMFDENPTAPGGFTWDNNVFFYSAPKSAVIVDKNCAQAEMRPSEVGKLTKHNIDRPHVLELDNTTKTVQSNDASKACSFRSKYLGNNRYSVYGCMPESWSKQKLNFALQDNKLMITNYLSNVIRNNKINLKGKVRFKPCNVKSHKLYVHYSSELKDIIKDTLENSCNVSAGALFKYMTAMHTKDSGNDEAGAEVMRDFLTQNGINKNSFAIYDGAGESRYNLVTPAALVQVLGSIYQDEKVRDLFIDALAQYGEGTMKSRNIEHNSAEENIYAKTGFLKNNSSITGFYLPDRKHSYAFTIMLGNHNLDGKEAAGLIDDVLLLVVNSIDKSKK